MIGASHSHDAPDTVGLWGPMETKVRDEAEYIKFLQDQIIEVAIAAYEDLGDINLSWGLGIESNYDEDRLSDDTDLFVIRGTRPDGEVAFTWVRANAHPTVWPMENNGISADWVGAFRKRLQENNSGVIVFNNGPIGSVYPSDPETCTETDAFPEGYQDPDVKPEDRAKVTCIGYRTADATLEAIKTLQPVDTAKGLVFRHKVFQFHPTNFILMQLGVGQQGNVPIPTIDVTDPTQMMDVSMSWVTLGDLEIVTTPGESFPTFGLHAKEILAQSTSGTAIILGLTQDWLGYLIPAELWLDDELAYNRSVSAGETMEPAYMDALQKMVDAEK